MHHLRGTPVKHLRRAVWAAVGTAALVAAPAWATPVPSWTYNISSQFLTSGPDAPTFESGSSVPVITPTQLVWGTPYAPQNPSGTRSSLVLNPSTGTGETVTTYQGNGTVPTAYISNPGITLTHNNFSVAAADGGQLTSATLQNTIHLTSPSFGGNPIILNLGINFRETPNTAGSCAVAPTPGNMPCPDIFVVDNDSLNYKFSFPDPDDSSVNRNYFLSLFPAEGGVVGQLSNAACSTAGAANGCFGFITQENQANEMDFGLTISTEPFVVAVPEPGVLGLMGLGLLGIGLALRRRRKSPDGNA